MRETDDERFLLQAIELARSARAAGNHPFGAVLVIDGEVAATAENTVNSDLDPTAHAETNLVRIALRRLSPQGVAGASLYTSCEPCAMCSGAIYWAGIRRVIYGLAASELGKLAGDDFLVPCRELFARAERRVEVVGPLLFDEAVSVHQGYWPHSHS